MNTAEEFLLKELKPRSGNLRTGVMNNDYAAKLMEEYANQQTADLTKENERLKSELRVSSDVNTLIKENIWLKEELKKMQDSLTSCQGELQSLQNEHRNLRGAICHFLNKGDLGMPMIELSRIEQKDGKWQLKEETK